MLFGTSQVWMSAAPLFQGIKLMFADIRQGPQSHAAGSHIYSTHCAGSVGCREVWIPGLIRCSYLCNISFASIQPAAV